MYLVHNGTVRETARAAVREGKADLAPVLGMSFSYDQGKVDAAVSEALTLPGISLVKVWLNRGELKTGDDIMLVLIGGDIRPHVTAALDFLVGRIKSECVIEKEVF
jgi:molybdopterin synthase catalytic subunit